MQNPERTQPVTVHITGGQKTKLKMLAVTHDTSMSEILRKLIDKTLGMGPEEINDFLTATKNQE